MKKLHLFDDSMLSDSVIINRHQDVDQFTLMHKDYPLLHVDESSGSVSVYYDNYKFLPFYLRARSSIDYTAFYNWASNRVLVLDRVNAKKILNACSLSQSDRYSVAKVCRLLSIDDCFWIKEKDSERWSDFDLRKNSLSEALGQIALNGEYVTISGDVMTPEFTNQGAFPKCWSGEHDGLYLYKKSMQDYESEKEVLASVILDSLGFNHVHYEMLQPGIDGICKCKCMTSDAESRLNFGEFRTYCKLKGLAPIKWIMDRYAIDFENMLIADYLLANTDRHPGNWGFFVDNDSGIITGLHPLYDHNASFDSTFGDQCKSTVLPKLSMLEAAQIAQQDLKLDLSNLLTIDKLSFYDCHADYDSFVYRVRQLQKL